MKGASCGHLKVELSLSEREYVCEACGIRIDRDLNAALNLVTVSLPETQTACGGKVKLLDNPFGLNEKQISEKQEPNSIQGQVMSKTV